MIQTVVWIYSKCWKTFILIENIINASLGYTLSSSNVIIVSDRLITLDLIVMSMAVASLFNTFRLLCFACRWLPERGSVRANHCLKKGLQWLHPKARSCMIRLKRLFPFQLMRSLMLRFPSGFPSFLIPFHSVVVFNWIYHIYSE